jgi:hypothetical protein
MFGTVGMSIATVNTGRNASSNQWRPAVYVENRQTYRVRTEVAIPVPLRILPVVSIPGKWMHWVQSHGESVLFLPVRLFLAYIFKLIFYLTSVLLFTLKLRPKIAVLFTSHFLEVLDTQTMKHDEQTMKHDEQWSTWRTTRAWQTIMKVDRQTWVPVFIKWHYKQTMLPGKQTM